MESKIQPSWQLDAISKHSTDSIMIIDTDQCIRFATPSVEHLFGVNPAGEKIHDFFQKVIYSEDMDLVIESYQHVVHEIKPGITDHRCIDRHGNVIHVECRTTPLEGRADNLSITIIRDITEKKQIEHELKRRKNRYEVLQNSLKQFSHDLTSIMKLADLEARLLKEVSTILNCSHASLVMYHKQNKKIDRIEYLNLIPFLAQLRDGKLGKSGNHYAIRIGERLEHVFNLVLVTPIDLEDAEIVWLETLVYYASMVFESLQVIENLMNQLESSVQERETTPLWILRLLFNLSEKERLNLSADLHDTVLQDQIVLDRNLKNLLLHTGLNDEMKEKLQQIEMGLEGTVHQIRSICNELRPPFLREQGLVNALENLFEYAQTYNSNYQIHFSYDIHSHYELDEERTVDMYRIIQELINNATKHSQASNIDIQLGYENDMLTLLYIDDGVGFNPDRLKPSFTNMGLTSMIQRVETLLGKIEFDSKPHEGLTVRLSIPIKSSLQAFRKN